MATAAAGKTRLERNFDDASAYVRHISDKLGTADLLYFYARFKQAREGQNSLPKPGFFEFQNRQKWQAWSDLGDMSRDQAMLEYVEMLDDIEPDWVSADLDNDDEKAADWVCISVTSEAAPAEDGINNEKTLFDYVKEGEFVRVKEALSQVDDPGELINQKDSGELGLLHWAADRGHVNLVNLLLDHGAHIDLQDHEGQTALHYAVAGGHLPVAELLLQRGIDKDTVDEDGLKAVDLATDEGCKTLLAEAP